MTRVLLGLGANTPYDSISPVELLGRACTELSRQIEGLVCSSVYRTRAMYVTDQNDFYNMAVRGMVDDSCSPENLLLHIHEIEASLGRDRNREIRFGPRSIDIDIELFGSRKIQSEELQIPHPRLHERAFVLVPALEILTESADCIEREMFAGYLHKLPDQGVRMYLSAPDFRKSYFPEAIHGTE